MFSSGGMYILIVEDCLELCNTWEDIFSLGGHRVSGFQMARDLLDRPDLIEKADILITDYYLPDMNGVSLIHQVRNRRPGLPVILLSGVREEDVIDNILKLPRSAYLAKPAGIQDLEDTVVSFFRSEKKERKEKKKEEGRVSVMNGSSSGCHRGIFS